MVGGCCFGFGQLALHPTDQMLWRQDKKLFLSFFQVLFQRQKKVEEDISANFGRGCCRLVLIFFSQDENNFQASDVIMSSDNPISLIENWLESKSFSFERWTKFGSRNWREMSNSSSVVSNFLASLTLVWSVGGAVRTKILLPDANFSSVDKWLPEIPAVWSI